MRSGKLTNRELDELGKRLIVAGQPSDREADSIVSNPRLYGGVLAKIAAADRPLIRDNGSGFAWKPVAAMAMAVVLLSVPLLAYLKFSGSGGQLVGKPRVTPNVVDKKPKPIEVVSPEPIDNEQPKATRAVMSRPVESSPLPRVRKSRIPRLPESEPAFHPIGLAERAEDAAIDGRVVRVEMPRAALFAMGVDVPLENGTRPVQAELLVGADGSPRAIRLVE